MPNTGTSPRRPATVSAAPATAAGSPGPLDRNTPSGPRASTSAAGVDPGDAGHVMATQEVVQALGGAPVAGAAGQIADQDAGAERPPALDVLGVHAVVPDVRVREGDHLPGVRRVGEDLLVTRERGVEHDLARRGTRLGNVADGLAFERRPVGQNEERVLTHRCAMPSTTTGSPRSTVWRTR